MARGLTALPAAALLWLLAPAVFAQNLTLTVSATPPGRNMISTAGRNDRALVVASGQTVSLVRESGLEQRRRANGGWFWTQIEDVPRDAERLVVTPRLLEDGSIEASIESLRREGTRLQSFRTVLSLQAGEWTELFSAGTGAAPDPGGGRTYGTAAAAGEALYLRIDP
jgi:hypothetical protein